MAEYGDIIPRKIFSRWLLMGLVILGESILMQKGRFLFQPASSLTCGMSFLEVYIIAKEANILILICTVIFEPLLIIPTALPTEVLGYINRTLFPLNKKEESLWPTSMNMLFYPTFWQNPVQALWPNMGRNY